MLACIALVATVTAVFAGLIALGHERVEDQLLEAMMAHEVEDYARSYRREPGRAPRASLLHSYVLDSAASAAALPEPLLTLPEGIHHDVPVGERRYQVAHFVVEGQRVYLTYDITDIEQRESVLTVGLSLALLLASVLTGLLAWRLSAMVLAPVTQLAQHIQRLDPAALDRAAPTPGQDASELGVIATAFDQFRQRLAGFVERERAFTAEASHELRTPVAVVATAAERLRGDPRLDDSLRPALERIRRAAQQMQLATQTLLFLAREDEPLAALATEPLAAAAGDLVATYRDLNPDQDIALVVDAESAAQGAAEGAAAPGVPSGPARILLGNLLQNAVSHAAGGRIVVSVEPELLSVRDNGPGIPAALLPRVFERGTRGPASSGQGIGLYLVWRICQRLGWHVDVDSVPGFGTTVTLRLRPVFTEP